MAGPTRCAVIGDPVAHSLSPVLHNAGYAAAGLADWAYEAVRVPAEGLADFIDRAAAAGLAGVSVTAPLKREALARADSVSATARLAGGANTLVRTEDGWDGHNTDLPGAVAAIRERWDRPLTEAVVLGGGATAASTGLALIDLGVERLRLAVRDPGRATETLAALMAHPHAPEITVVHLTDARADGGIVVSTIPVAAQSPELVARMVGAQVLFEATYNTWPTPLVAAAQDTGAVIVSGLDLLVHQAVLQFEMFTGRPGPLAQMRAAGEAALAAR